MSDQLQFGRYAWSVPDAGIDSIGRYLGRFTAGTRPTAPLEGTEYLDLDSMTFYKYNGTAWVEMSGSFIGIYTANDQPETAGIGKEIFRSDNGQFRKWNGTEWVVIGTAGDGGGFTVSNRTDFPTVGETNEIVYRTDLNEYYIYDGTSEVWRILSARKEFLGSVPGTTGSGVWPSPAEVGQEVYRPDIGEFYKFNGTHWMEI